MHYRILFLLLFSFVAFNVSNAQNFGAAIILKSSDLTVPYGDKYIAALKKKIPKARESDLVFYTWNKKNDKPEIYEPFKSENFKEQPITIVAYLEADLKNFDKLTLTSTLDTLGKPNGYYFNTFQSVSPKWKVVHLPTSEVLSSGQVSVHLLEKNGGKIAIKDYAKYSKLRPEVLRKTNSKKYKEVFDKLKKDNQKKINGILNESIDEANNYFSAAISVLYSCDDTRLWTMTGDQAQDKKFKELWMDATEAEKVYRNENIGIYAKQTYGDIDVYETLSRRGVDVLEVTPTKTKVKTSVFNRKKITKAIENGDEIIFVRSPQLFRASNVDSDEYKRVQIKSECFTCALGLESMLAGIPNVKLIERQFSPVRDYFVDQYTDEKFIDFQMEKVQGIAEGVDYLFEIENGGLQATEIATGRIESLDKKEGKGLLEGLFSGGRGAEISNLSLNILDERVELAEISKAKKDKAKEVILYSPVGFGGSSKVKVVREIEESVGGRSIIREEEIGELAGRWDLWTTTVRNFKVKDGEKEIYAAHAAGEKLKYIIQ